MPAKITVTEGLKRCCRCKETKLPEEFNKNKSTSDGLCAYCIPCMREYNTQHRQKHLEHYRQYDRDRRASTPEVFRERDRRRRTTASELFRARDKVRWGRRRDRQLAYSRAYRLEHGERIRERDNQYHHKVSAVENSRRRARRLANLETERQKYAIYRSRNRDKVRAWDNKKRAKRLQAAGNITALEWATLKAQYNYRCLRCGKAEPEIKLTIDHVVPLSRGGTNLIANAQPLCGPCNGFKHAKTIDYRDTYTTVFVQGRLF